MQFAMTEIIVIQHMEHVIAGAHQMQLPTHGSSNFSLQYCKDFVKMVMGEDY